MEFITDVSETLHAYFYEPLVSRFFGLFDVNGRLGLLFLTISYLVAFALYRHRKRRRGTQAPSFWAFLGGGRVHLHRSALLDYRYYFAAAVLKVACVVPVVALVDPYILKSGDYIAFFNNLWGARPAMNETLGLTLLYGLGIFLINDFKHYWVHRAFHSRWLWDFHKVHHSAPVLVPATASRIHFVEKIAEKIATGVIVGGYAGLFWYLCGGQVDRYTLFGVTYLVFLFNTLAANLRHSHVWLSFGPKLEHLLNSPAQHQIHHSDTPLHFNKNFGTNLSVWDWMFGTLYVTTSHPEPLRFGIGERESLRFMTLYGLIVTPFVDVTSKCLRRHKRQDRKWASPSS